MGAQLFKGTWANIKLQVRQYKWAIFIWLAIIITLNIAVAFAYPDIYPTQEDLIGFGYTMDNPAMVAMLGPSYPPEDYTIPLVFTGEMFMFMSILIVVMNILLTASMTRGNEEEGRLEIVRALPIGRLAASTASFIILIVINAIIAFSSAIGIGYFGPEAFTLSGSYAYGFGQASLGMFFVGLTLVFAQITDNKQTTNQSAFASLFIFYIIRALADVNESDWTLLSPLGWLTKIQPFMADNWWPILGLSVATLALVLLAYILLGQRDIQAGILPATSKGHHSSWLVKYLPGFILKQEGMRILSWATGIFLLAAAFGSILGELDTYFSDMEILQYFLDTSNQSMTEAFIQLLYGIMTIFIAIPGISIINSIRQEEIKGRIDHFYSRPVARWLVLLNYYLVAAFTLILLLALLAFGMYITSQNMLDPTSFINYMETAWRYLPSLLFMISIAVLAVGLVPKLFPVIWLYTGFTFLVMYMGELLTFPDWLNNLSIFQHIPEDGHLATLTMVLILSFTIARIGIYAYGKRDITA